MLDDDLTDSVGIDEADVEDKWDEVVVEYNRLQEEVRGNEDPGHKVGDEPIQRHVERFLLLPADIEDVLDAMSSHKRSSAPEGAKFGGEYLDSVLKTKTTPPYTIHHSFQERL